MYLGNTGWSKYQDRAYKGKLVGYQANRFYRMLMPNGKVKVFSNVQWINNVPPKPSQMELTPSGVQQANNSSLSETRNKRRNDAIHSSDIDPTAPSTSFPGESASKRRRENSVEAADSTVPVTKQYLTAVRIPLAAPPVPIAPKQKPAAPVQVPSAQPTRVQPRRGTRGDLPEVPIPAQPVPSTPRAASGESSGLSDPPTESESEPPDVPGHRQPEPLVSPDTLSNNTLTPSTVSKNSVLKNPVTMPTTRSMSDRQPSGQQQPLRHEVLRAHRDLSPDPLSLLAKANAPEPYEPQTYKEAMADEYMKMHWELAI